jgi:hypothetical protein
MNRLVVDGLHRAAALSWLARIVLLSLQLQ